MMKSLICNPHDKNTKNFYQNFWQKVVHNLIGIKDGNLDDRLDLSYLSIKSDILRAKTDIATSIIINNIDKYINIPDKSNLLHARCLIYRFIETSDIFHEHYKKDVEDTFIIYNDVTIKKETKKEYFRYIKFMLTYKYRVNNFGKVCNTFTR